MKNRTKEFDNLFKYYYEIKAFQKGVSVDVDVFAKRFLIELQNINIQYDYLKQALLTFEEMLKVQQMINRTTGNRNVSISIRRAILNESLAFNEMVERTRSKEAMKNIKLEADNLGIGE